jgi:hypothetical protein
MGLGLAYVCTGRDFRHNISDQTQVYMATTVMGFSHRCHFKSLDEAEKQEPTKEQEGYLSEQSGLMDSSLPPRQALVPRSAVRKLPSAPAKNVCSHGCSEIGCGRNNCKAHTKRPLAMYRLALRNVNSSPGCPDCDLLACVGLNILYEEFSSMFVALSVCTWQRLVMVKPN